MAFLEEQFPLEINVGSAFGEQYAVDEVVTAGGNEYRALRHPYPVLRHEIDLALRMDEWMIENILDLYHRCGGRFGGFRLRNHADYSTNDYRGAPTSGDQPCQVIDATAGTHQLMRWYGSPSDPMAPRRRIRKPVSGSVLCGIKAANGITYPITAFTVDSTRGIITLSANKQRTITGITQGAQAVVTVGSGHGIVEGDSVVISGVAGMTEINGLRATVTATTSTTITLGSINSTGFTAYASGGQVNTRPQAGETLMAGCYFDLPVRFESDLSGMAYAGYKVMGTTVSLVEILNPDPQ